MVSHASTCWAEAVDFLGPCSQRISSRVEIQVGKLPFSSSSTTRAEESPAGTHDWSTRTRSAGKGAATWRGAAAPKKA